MHELPRLLHGRSVVVVVLEVATLVELVELEVVGGGCVELVVVGRTVVVVGPIVVVVGRTVVVVDEPGAFVVDVIELLEVLLVALVLVTFVLLVTLVLVGRVLGGRLVVVVLVTTIGTGHAVGAGALCATKRPGLSLPILPPKRRQ